MVELSECDKETAMYLIRNKFTDFYRRVIDQPLLDHLMYIILFFSNLIQSNSGTQSYFVARGLHSQLLNRCRNDNKVFGSNNTQQIFSWYLSLQIKHKEGISPEQQEQILFFLGPLMRIQNDIEVHYQSFWIIYYYFRENGGASHKSFDNKI